MNNETFNKNLETIFDEIDMNELEPNLDDCLKDEDLAKKIYNLIFLLKILINSI
jgi:hypothetical protein